MAMPIEITCRGVPKTEAIDRWVRRLAENKIEPVCDHVNRCEVAIERPNERVTSGSGYRVRINLTVAPSHQVTVSREQDQGSIRDNLYSVLQGAFSAARKSLKKLSELQQGATKRHPAHEPSAVVTQLFAEHGFLGTTDGREIYFHRNSVLGHGADGLRVGAAVAFTEELGDHGPQASTVRVLDSRGGRRQTG